MIIAIGTATVGLIWVRVPHADASPGRQITSTYDAGVGMVDLYLRDDYRGFERLYAAELLANHHRLDESFSQTLAESARAHNEETEFCHIDAELAARLDCPG